MTILDKRSIKAERSINTHTQQQAEERRKKTESTTVGQTDQQGKI